jgi:phosphoribosylformylglycinamidine synthase
MLFGLVGLGAVVDLSGLPSPRQDALLFGESQGRALVSAAPADEPAVLAAAAAAGVPADSIGEVTADGALTVKTARGPLEWAVSGLRAGWETSIETAMKRPGLG